MSGGKFFLKVCHLTSVHPRYDSRIFLKQCRSLAAAGYETTLIVADGKGSEERDGVAILDVGGARGRIDRMRNVTRRVLAEALSVDAEIYHFHDPELIPAGISLKRRGKRVIFDSHEDVPVQILSKPYLGKPARVVLSHAIGALEKWACRRFDAVVAATPTILEKFKRAGSRSVNVNNFPLADELLGAGQVTGESRTSICYIGGISANRGVREIVNAMEHVATDVSLAIAGNFVNAELRTEVMAYKGWEQVREMGFVDRAGVRNILNGSIAGLVTLHPTRAYIDSLPIKMFEYMSAGVPVIASNFPLWREIVEGSDCGVCVDPMDPGAIATAIDFLANNRSRAIAMGENGRQAVLQKYNWTQEERKLLDLYGELSRVDR